MTPAANEGVSDAEIMAALDAIPNDDPDDPPIAPDAGGVKINIAGRK